MICIDTTVLIDEFRARGSLDAPVNRAMLTYGAEILIVPVIAGSLLSIFALVRLGNRRTFGLPGRHRPWQFPTMRNREFFRQMTLPPDERMIPAQELCRAEALETAREYARMPERRPY